MKRWFQYLAVCLVLLPLVVGAETISWINPTTHVDGTPIDTATRAKIGVYLRGWKAGNPSAKTYFGETRGGLSSWTDNVLVQMNRWGAGNAVPGWVPLVAGDNVQITASAFYTYADNTGATRENEGPESAPLAYTIPAPAPPPWKPPPSCSAPTGLTIRQ